MYSWEKYELIRVPDSWSKGGKLSYLDSGRSGGRSFFSRVNFVCWLLFRVRSALVVPQWHVKDPGHFAKSAGGRLHPNVHTPLTQRSRSGLTIPLSSHCVGIYQETSSHATRQVTLRHCRLSLPSQCVLILAWRMELVCASYLHFKKKKKSAGGEWMVMLS